MGKKSREKKERRVQGWSGTKKDAGALPPLPDRRALEKEMANLHRLLVLLR
jgi:hypothetical protein